MSLHSCLDFVAQYSHSLFLSENTTDFNAKLFVNERKERKDNLDDGE